MMRLDYVLFRADGSLAALVEATASRETTPEWATQFRRNLMDYPELPPADFFVFVARDWIYLWRNAGKEAILIPPHAVIPTAPLLSRYFENKAYTLETAHPVVFDWTVGDWLSDLCRPWGKAGDLALEHGLAGTGFVEALRGGRIKYKDVA